MSQTGSGKLEVSVQGDKEILMRRVFDAPRHLVFETMTKPEYIRRWWCCMQGYTMPVCEYDFRVGGKWRFVMVGADGVEIAFNGEIREIVVPERIVQTEIFEMFPDEVTVCTMTLEERDGRTYYQNHILHATKEGRDGHIASGMQVGADIALDRIDEIAQSLTPLSGPASASSRRAPSL